MGGEGRDGIEPNGPSPLPVLLRGARATFGSVIRRKLATAGYEDVPPNGLFVLGAIGEGSTPLAEVITALRVSKQTAGALVDSLVVRGYLDRRADPTDRRRMVVSLTDRGADAAAVIRDTVIQLEASLEATVGSEAVAHARQALAALTRMGCDEA
jgi:DNA-binding MarR family transcriptional regulator